MVQVVNAQALADLLDDLTTEELTNLIFWCWTNQWVMRRSTIKAFRKNIGKLDND